MVQASNGGQEGTNVTGIPDETAAKTEEQASFTRPTESARESVDWRPTLGRGMMTAIQEIRRQRQRASGKRLPNRDK